MKIKMSQNIRLIGLRGIPFIKPGDNIAKIILKALKNDNLTLENGDIIVIAQTIISKSVGRIKDLKDIKPSEEAYQLYQKMEPLSKDFDLPIKPPELIQAILDESREILKAEHVMIVETKQGFVCANAGIDKSNVEGESKITFLPENSDLEARKIHNVLYKLTGTHVAIIISDSFGRAFRVGAVGVGIGVAGINPILDKRGSIDLYGKELKSTIVGQIDNLASAAQLIMGESNEGLPIVLIRGYKFEFVERSSIDQIIREKESDLFRLENRKDEFLKVLKTRRSYKLKFSEKRIENEVIKHCIEIARWAPSAHNGQFWRYVILKKDKVRYELIEKMNKKLKEDLIKDGKSDQEIEEKISKTKKNFIKSPYLILLCLDKQDLYNFSDLERDQNEFIMGVQSVSASATYLQLAFEAYGLASCWYCAPLFAKEIITDTLNLPASSVPMAFFTVGFPLYDVKAPKRKPLNEIIYNY
jgi:coenzyme F420-0:L-glutamate ligase/coenzyme F420-1:gamma-L-glutamate ligase